SEIFFVSFVSLWFLWLSGQESRMGTGKPHFSVTTKNTHTETGPAKLLCYFGSIVEMQTVSLIRFSIEISNLVEGYYFSLQPSPFCIFSDFKVDCPIFFFSITSSRAWTFLMSRP